MCKIAILLATYNGGRYVQELLDSLLEQTVADFSIYAHDDGSTDGTTEILKKYEIEHPDKLKRLQYPSVGGARNNFLSMLERVEADYYMFCDQDDIWSRMKLEVSIDRMKQLEEEFIGPCLVFSDMKVVNQKLKVIDDSFMKYMNKNPYDLSPEKLIVQNVAAGCTMMINKQLAHLVKSYQDKENIFMHDWWCLLVASLVGRISYIDQPLVLYRQHGNNTVGVAKDQWKWFKEKLVNILRGTQISASREGISYQRKMAYELSQLTGLTKEKKEYLNNLVEIEKCGKIERIRFYMQNGLIKKNLKNFWKIILV